MFRRSDSQNLLFSACAWLPKDKQERFAARWEGMFREKAMPIADRDFNRSYPFLAEVPVNLREGYSGSEWRGLWTMTGRGTRRSWDEYLLRNHDARRHLDKRLSHMILDDLYRGGRIERVIECVKHRKHRVLDVLIFFQIINDEFHRLCLIPRKETTMALELGVVRERGCRPACLGSGISLPREHVLCKPFGYEHSRRRGIFGERYQRCLCPRALVGP
jgi:hypothetical protein